MKDQTFDESQYDKETPQDRAEKREKRRQFFEKAHKKQTMEQQIREAHPDIFESDAYKQDPELVALMEKQKK